ncbi:flagellar filament capping protein FliD [Rhodococcus sp. X156]|uniref:flagellar filament capping protein FliD n=1 Tax=Rhodococcus sp. X156 TaxID=2499145 RepID=UPI000FDB074F|nr:flagellar filament capping protein FliD [Rhodococcus sp. X156]
MATFSFDGLASGIDTKTLVTQLMQVAAQPQAQLKTQLSSTQTLVSAYQSINTRITALQSAADAVKLAGTWTAATASSSSPSVIATSTSAAQAGSAMTFSVTRLAAAQVSTVAVAGDVVADFAAGIDVTIGSGSTATTTHVALTGGSASDVVAALSKAGLGVRASVVNVDDATGTGTTQRLQLSSTSTGTAGAFSISGLSTAPTQIVAAQNAQLTVGDPAAGGYSVSSSTNTFTEALPGVTFTVGALASGVTVSVASDTTAITKAMQTMVDAANAALGQVGMYTAKGGSLQGNTQVVALSQDILSSISRGTGTGGSFHSIGVQLTNTGGLAFDATVFAAAYAADPAKTQAVAGQALGSALSTVAERASAPAVGSLSLLITSGNERMTNLNKQIQSWDTRLADTQTAMQKKYAAMEAAVNKLNSTQAWLSSALSSLDASKKSD